MDQTLRTIITNLRALVMRFTGYSEGESNDSDEWPTAKQAADVLMDI